MTDALGEGKTPHHTVLKCTNWYPSTRSHYLTCPHPHGSSQPYRQAIRHAAHAVGGHQHGPELRLTR